PPTTTLTPSRLQKKGTAMRCRNRGAAFASLLRFEDEAGFAVQVDAAGGGGAVAVVELDRLLEDVGVLAVVLDGGVGLFDVEEGAQLVGERLRVRHLGRRRALPAADEVLGCHAGQCTGIEGANVPR